MTTYCPHSGKRAHYEPCQLAPCPHCGRVMEVRPDGHMPKHRLPSKVRV